MGWSTGSSAKDNNRRRESLNEEMKQGRSPKLSWSMES